jgi:hypothetical protein
MGRGNSGATKVSPSDATLLATLMTATPGLRAKLFTNPTKQVSKNLPSDGRWNYDPGKKGTDPSNPIPAIRFPFGDAAARRRASRARLYREVIGAISADVTDGKLQTTVNTDAIFEEYFAPLVRVSQRSLRQVLLLTWLAFAAGLALIGAGVWIAVDPPKNVNSTLVASIFGTGGAASTLGAMYARSKQGIREATLDVVKLRMVLTGFATQLGQLRSIAEAPISPVSSAGQEVATSSSSLDSIRKVNTDITGTVAAAIAQLSLTKSADPSGSLGTTSNGDDAGEANKGGTDGSGSNGSGAPPANAPAATATTVD